MGFRSIQENLENIFSGQGPEGGDQWVVINPAKILFSAFINNVCSIKSGSASPAEKFQSE